MFLVRLFTHTRTQTQHHYDDDDAVLPKRGNPQRPGAGCRVPGAGWNSPEKSRVLDGSIGSAKNNEAKWENMFQCGKHQGTNERKRREICGTIRGRTRRLPAAALALTVALAPSNTERQTVDSTKAAGTAPLCPPFSSMCPSRALPLLSLSWAVLPSYYLACTQAFLRSFSFCRSVSRARLHFRFFAVYFFSPFPSFYTRHRRHFRPYFSPSVSVCRWEENFLLVFLAEIGNSRSSLSRGKHIRYSLLLFFSLCAQLLANEPSHGPAAAAAAAEPVRKPVTGTTRHTKAIKRLVGRPRIDQS